MKKILFLVIALFASMTNLEPSQALNTSFDSAMIEPLHDISGFNNLVIFIRFNDEITYTAPYSLSYYEDMFNGVGKVSLRDYYLEASYGETTIDSYLVTSNDQIVYVTDIWNRGYYEPYDAVSNPEGYQNESERGDREMTLLKRTIDFVEDNNLVPDDLNLDVNEDGAIDSITFLVSGEAGDWNVLLWPHKWEMYEYYNYEYNRFDTNAPQINGKYAFHFTFELLGNRRSYEYAVTVAILAHETFHLFGSPDLYHYYRYNWIAPVGNWGLMEDIDKVPRHMLGYMKYQYGDWIDTVQEITQDGTYTLYPLQDSADNLYRINTGYSNEYVYLEYRDDTGLYDSYVPNSGLLVYRVDLDYINEGNEEGYYLEGTTTPYDEVFIFRPGLYDTEPPITFPSTDSASIDEDGAIDDAALSQYNLYDEMGIGTNIPMFHSDGTIMDITIYNVTEHDGYITFDVRFTNPRIQLNTQYDYVGWDGYTLLDTDDVTHTVSIINIPSGYDVYYTTNGTTPTTSSTLYTGEEIVITSDHNTVRAILVYNGTIIDTISETYAFYTDTAAPTVELNSGTDTIYVGDEYFDPSVTASDNFFNSFTLEVVENTVDTTTAGTYHILYKVTDDSGNATYLERYVTVLESISQETICQPGLTTYYEYDEFIAQDCTINGMDAAVDDTTLDMTTSGTYSIQYYIDLPTGRLSYTSYVFVLNRSDVNLSYILPKKEEYSL